LVIRIGAWRTIRGHAQIHVSVSASGFFWADSLAQCADPEHTHHWLPVLYVVLYSRLLLLWLLDGTDTHAGSDSISAAIGHAIDTFVTVENSQRASIADFEPDQHRLLLSEWAWNPGPLDLGGSSSGLGTLDVPEPY
jgi:hypothetical protein